MGQESSVRIRGNLVLKKLLNRSESVTYGRLREVCSANGAQVFGKVRLADVLPIEGSGIPDAAFEYALKAHYDFVIVDDRDQPLFAVEFDGPGHAAPDQQRRDRNKDSISRHFKLEVIRIDTHDLKRDENDMDVLTRRVEHWFELRAARSRAMENTPMARVRCPICGGETVERQGKFGLFLGCRAYPKCKGTVQLPVAEPQERVATVAKPPAPRPAQIASVTTPAPEPTRPAASPANKGVYLAAGAVVAVVGIAAVLLLRGGDDKPAPATQSVAAATQTPKANTPAPTVNTPAVEPAPAKQSVAATKPQVNLLQMLIRRKGWGDADRDQQIRRELGYQRMFGEITKSEASKLIDAWDDRKDSR